MNVDLRIGIRHSTGSSYGAFLYFPYLFYKQVAPTGATVFSCTAPSYQNFPYKNVTYVTTLKISCKLTTSRMLHLAVFLFNGVFALKFPCCQQAAVISCCRHNCLLCQLSISHPQSTKQQNSTPRSGSRASPCTPASGGQPPRAYMTFQHRTSSLSVFPSHEILEKTQKLIWEKKEIFFCFSQFSRVSRATRVSDSCTCASHNLQINNDRTIHRKGAENAKKINAK